MVGCMAEDNALLTTSAKPPRSRSWRDGEAITVPLLASPADNSRGAG